ncbi:hypothetical protein Tco_1071213, partial [Tanacetum coccineum]
MNVPLMLNTTHGREHEHEQLEHELETGMKQTLSSSDDHHTELET